MVQGSREMREGQLIALTLVLSLPPILLSGFLNVSSHVACTVLLDWEGHIAPFIRI